MKFSYIFEKIDAHYRESWNKYFAPYRRKKLKYQDFTIISNNCWGGHVYRYFGMPYNSPTVGLFIFSEDYIKLVSNLEHYMNKEIEMISHDESKHKDELERRGKVESSCPIGRIDDIEIIFLHYKSDEEAKEKWTRRKERIHWNHVYVKMSEQNLCKEEHLKAFDRLPFDNKFVFVHKHFGLDAEVLYKEWESDDYVKDDTFVFHKYINLIKWINGEKDFKLRQQ